MFLFIWTVILTYYAYGNKIIVIVIIVIGKEALTIQLHSRKDTNISFDLNTLYPYYILHTSSFTH